MNKYIQFSFLGLILLTFNISVSAQEIWSLEKCVRHSQQNSLSIKQSAIAIQNAKLTEQGHVKSRLPNLNGGFSVGMNSGRSIDPITNSFTTNATGSNGISLSSGLLLYNGGRIKNSIKQAQYDIAAAEANAQQTSYDLALNVAAAYLNILLSEEQLENSNKRIAQSRNQLDQIDKLIKAGSRPKNDRLDILATIALDEQDIVNKENAIEIAYLNLKQLLLLEPDYDLKIDKPEIPIPDAATLDYQLSEVYSTAVQQQPAIKAGDMNLKSAEIGVDIAKAGARPSVNLSAAANTVYSTRPLIPEDPYFNQLSRNFRQNFGANVSIPIYNNHRTRINVERAELNILQTQLNNQQVRQRLKSDIQTAIANAKAAGKTLEASQQTVEARSIAYENTQKRFDLGAINSFELTTSKNNLDQAQVNLIVAKYDYLFKLKIVDYYMGNEMKF